MSVQLGHIPELDIIPSYIIYVDFLVNFGNFENFRLSEVKCVFHSQIRGTIVTLAWAIIGHISVSVGPLHHNLVLK